MVWDPLAYIAALAHGPIVRAQRPRDRDQCQDRDHGTSGTYLCLRSLGIVVGSIVVLEFTLGASESSGSNIFRTGKYYLHAVTNLCHFSALLITRPSVLGSSAKFPNSIWPDDIIPCK